MYKKLLTLAIASILLSCNTTSKDVEVQTNTPLAQESTTKFEDYTDNLGDKLSVSTDEQGRKTIKFNGSVYLLEKDFESNTYSTSDNQYQLTETNKEITFVKKNYNMVLFKTKKNNHPSAS